MMETSTDGPADPKHRKLPVGVMLGVLALVVGVAATSAVFIASDDGDGHHRTAASVPHHRTAGMADMPGMAGMKQDHSDGHSQSTAFVFGEHHASAPCNPTPVQRAAADRLLARTKAGLARLANIDVARAEGYMRYGDVAIQGTWHYINWKYQADRDVLNADKPESIVYWQASPTSPLLLIGAMYVVPTAKDLGPTVGGCLTRWHQHGEPFAPKGQLTDEMLHVWTIPMPDGPFV